MTQKTETWMGDHKIVNSFLTTNKRFEVTVWDDGDVWLEDVMWGDGTVTTFHKDEIAELRMFFDYAIEDK